MNSKQINNQIVAIRYARRYIDEIKTAKPTTTNFRAKVESSHLNDAANTLTALDILLNAKGIKEEFTRYVAKSRMTASVYYTEGELMVMYLRERGLPL